MINSQYIVRVFKSRIISQSGIKVCEIQNLCREELKVYIGKTVCRRAKVLLRIAGGFKMEFAVLMDYVDEIRRSNPGSTCFIKTQLKEYGEY